MQYLVFTAVLLVVSASVQCQLVSQNASRSNTLSPENAVFLFVDHQTGLANGIRDHSLEEYMLSVTGLAKTASIFNVPSIITSSNHRGPNGPVLPDIYDILPNATIIHRPGEINAWDNAQFVEAVRATGRRKMVVSGIVTDVCVAFLALSLVREGYDVYAVIDASGTYNELARDTSVQRMVQSNVIPMSWFAVACELQNDWRRPTGSEFAELLSEHLPFYGNLIDQFNATQNATFNGGQ